MRDDGVKVCAKAEEEEEEEKDAVDATVTILFVLVLVVVRFIVIIFETEVVVALLAAMEKRVVISDIFFFAFFLVMREKKTKRNPKPLTEFFEKSHLIFCKADGAKSAIKLNQKRPLHTAHAFVSLRAFAFGDCPLKLARKVGEKRLTLCAYSFSLFFSCEKRNTSRRERCEKSAQIIIQNTVNIITSRRENI